MQNNAKKQTNAKKYKIWHDWVGKVIHSKKLKFDYATKWNMHKPESEEWGAQNSLGFWDTNRSPIPEYKNWYNDD